MIDDTEIKSVGKIWLYDTESRSVGKIWLDDTENRSVGKIWLDNTESRSVGVIWLVRTTCWSCRSNLIGGSNLLVLSPCEQSDWRIRLVGPESVRAIWLACTEGRYVRVIWLAWKESRSVWAIWLVCTESRSVGRIWLVRTTCWSCRIDLIGRSDLLVLKERYDWTLRLVGPERAIWLNDPICWSWKSGMIGRSGDLSSGAFDGLLVSQLQTVVRK